MTCPRKPVCTYNLKMFIPVYLLHYILSLEVRMSQWKRVSLHYVTSASLFVRENLSALTGNSEYQRVKMHWSSSLDHLDLALNYTVTLPF